MLKKFKFTNNRYFDFSLRDVKRVLTYPDDGGQGGDGNNDDGQQWQQRRRATMLQHGREEAGTVSFLPSIFLSLHVRGGPRARGAV